MGSDRLSALLSHTGQIADTAGRPTREFYGLISALYQETARVGGAVSGAATVDTYRAMTTGVPDMAVIAAALAEVTLTDAATIAWDATSGLDFAVTLGGNRTLGAMANTGGCIGKKGRLRIIQDGVGGRTLTKHSSYKTANGVALTLTATAGAVDVFTYDIVADGVVYLYAAGLAFT